MGYTNVCRCLRAVCFLTVWVGVSAASLAQISSIDEKPQLVVDANGFTSVKIDHVKISGDGKFLAVAAGKIVRVWDLQSGQLWCTLRGFQERQGYHIGYIDSISFTPDAKYLAVGVSDNVSAGSTRLYDLKNPSELKELIPGQTGCSRQVGYSPDGDFMVTYG